MKLKKILEIIAFKYNQYKYKERLIHPGEKNPEKTFYVIRRVSMGEGMGSETINFAAEIGYALDMGYIPVIDRKNYYNPMIQERIKKGMDNAWDYYYMQPANYSVDEAYECKNVILSNAFNSKHWMYRPQLHRILHDKDYREEQIKIWEKAIVPTKLLNKELENAKKEMTMLNKPVLGVSTRLVLQKTYKEYMEHKRAIFDGFGWSREPELDALIEDIENKLDLWKCEYVYICDNTSKFIPILKEHFKDRMLYFERKKTMEKFYLSNPEGNENDGAIRIKDAYNNSAVVYNNYMYMMDIAKLSACKCLMGTLNSTTIMAVMMNKNLYEYEWYYDLGVYSK